MGGGLLAAARRFFALRGVTAGGVTQADAKSVKQPRGRYQQAVAVPQGRDRASAGGVVGGRAAQAEDLTGPLDRDDEREPLGLADRQRRGHLDDPPLSQLPFLLPIWGPFVGRHEQVLHALGADAEPSSQADDRLRPGLLESPLDPRDGRDINAGQDADCLKCQPSLASKFSKGAHSSSQFERSSIGTVDNPPGIPQATVLRRKLRACGLRADRA